MTGQLSDGDLDRIFAADIVPVLMNLGGGVAARPEAVMFAAQPGAAKSSSIAEHAPAATHVPIVGDDMRQFHPDHEHLIGGEPPSAGDAGRALEEWLGPGLTLSNTCSNVGLVTT